MQIDKPLDLDDRVLAVDGDIIAYKTAAVCEEHFEKACEEIIDTTLTNIATDTGIEDMRIYISGENNFRKEVGVTLPYKGNRATMVAPKFLNHCKQYLCNKYRAIRMNGYEADDGIATDMTRNNAIHCGIDKDMFQIAGLHFNYIKKEWYEISAEEATVNLYRQILMGDRSDNIPGLPGIGVKKAEALVYSADNAAEYTLLAYEDICKQKMPEKDFKKYFAEQAALITMIKDVDLFKVMTTRVAMNVQGFDAEEGDFEGFEKPKAVKIKI